MSNILYRYKNIKINFRLYLFDEFLCDRSKNMTCASGVRGVDRVFLLAVKLASCLGLLPFLLPPSLPIASNFSIVRERTSERARPPISAALALWGSKILGMKRRLKRTQRWKESGVLSRSVFFSQKAPCFFPYHWLLLNFLLIFSSLRFLQARWHERTKKRRRLITSVLRFFLSNCVLNINGPIGQDGIQMSLSFAEQCR